MAHSVLKRWISYGLVLVAGMAVAAGCEKKTVTGVGADYSPSGGGNVTVDFSNCPVADRAVWLAYQDSAGPWVRVIGVNDLYSFNITSGRGGLAYVLLGQSGIGTSSVEVQYRTQAEFTAAPLAFCPPTPPGKTVNGTGAGIGETDIANISLGGGSATGLVTDGPFEITGVADGIHDLVAYRRSFVGGVERAIIRRDLNIPNTGSVGTLDFAGPEAIVPATATIMVGGLVGGEWLFQSISYHLGATCAEATLYDSEPVDGSSFTASGIPAGQQRASDYHAITLLATGATGFRAIAESFHTIAARTVTLGALLPTPTISSLGGPYKRLQAVYMLPGDYQGSTEFGYSDAGRSVRLSATFGYLGGAATTLALANYSGLAEWDDSWAPAASASSVSWTLSGESGFTSSPCTENARFKFALESGTF
jgi:hypothetical protein